MRFEDIASLLQPEKLPYVSGVERLADGAVHVAVLTRMPGMSPAMIGWWFDEYIQTTEHYKRWHPRDHVWMAWEGKQPGTCIGATHLVHEYIGGRMTKLRIRFVPPSDFFGDALDAVPGAVAVCAHPGDLKRSIEMGRLVHLALPTPWGCELHSRFWLGYLSARGGGGLLERVASRPALRRAAASMTLGRALAVHCHEEMTTLAGFLPELYAAETGGA